MGKCIDCQAHTGAAPDGTDYKRCMICNSKKKATGAPGQQRVTSPMPSPMGREPGRIEADAKRSAQVRRQAVLNTSIAFHQNVLVKARADKPTTEEDIIKTASEFEKWVIEAS